MHQAAHQEISKSILAGVGITCLLMLASARLPLIGFVTTVLIPLPVLFYRIKLGRNLGAAVPVAALILMLSTGGGVGADTLFFSGLMFLGFILAEFIEMNISVEKTVVFTSAAVFLAGLLSIFLYGNITNTGVGQLVTGYVEENLKITLSLYKSMGVPEDKVTFISNALDTIKYLLVRILPALSVAMVMLITLINILSAGPVLRKSRLFYPEYGPFIRWKAPENLVWTAIASGIALMLPIKVTGIIGLNVIIVLAMVYFFQGLAIVQFYFEKRRFPIMLRVVIYTLITIQQFLLILVIGLGFFDTWLNFRRLGQDTESRQ